MAKGIDKHWLDPPDWWKKWKPLRWLAVLTIVGGAASGLWSALTLVLDPGPHPDTAAFMAAPKSRVLLMGTFNSYDDLAAVTAQLSAAGYEWTIQKNHRMPNPDFPPRDLDVVSVPAYQHLGAAGILRLKFFNNRLYETEFQPVSAEAYAAPLRNATSGYQRDRIGKVDMTQGSLRLASNVELAGSPVGQSLHSRPYAIWQDLRLIRQLNEWDENYGSIPYKAAQK